MTKFCRATMNSLCLLAATGAGSAVPRAAAAGEYRVDAEIPFRQSDFGIDPCRALLGAIRNGDEALLVVHLVAVERAAASQAVEPSP